MSDTTPSFWDEDSLDYDSTTVEYTSIDDIDTDTLKAFRDQMRSANPDHRWNSADKEEFLRKIGAVGHATDQLTVAGLLRFGKEEAILGCIPGLKLDYMECRTRNTEWSYRRLNGTGEWVGNIYNFFTSIRDRLETDPHGAEHADVRRAVRECLVNCLVNTDYHRGADVKIERYPERIVMRNSGSFLIPLDDAETGGRSYPRNPFLAKMFFLIGMSERAGVGLNHVFETWLKRFGSEPVITQDRMSLYTVVELDMSEEPDSPYD